MPTEVLGEPIGLTIDEECLRTIVDSTFDAILVVDTSGRVVFQSPAVERMLGYTVSERQMQSAFDLVHEDDLARARGTFRDLMAGRVDNVRTEVHARHKDGSTRILETITTSLLDNPTVRGLLIVARDVTEQRTVDAERQQLLESEHLARTAAEMALDQLLSLQSVADQLSGAQSAEMVAAVMVTHATSPLRADACRIGVLDRAGKNLVMLGRNAQQDPLPAVWRRFSLDSAAPLAEAARTGEAVWIESGAEWAARFAGGVRHRGEPCATASLPLLISGRVSGAIAWVFNEDRAFGEHERLFMRILARQCGQAMERARLYQAVGERERRLHDLVRRLLAGHEEERRRVAYELHDGLAQVAAGTHQHLQVMASRYPPTSEAQREELARALELAQRTVREARNLISGLRPTVLDDFGLARALHVELEAMATEGWEVSFDERLGTLRLPQPIEIALFRALQEALSNIRKHAGPTRVLVSLLRRGDTVQLMVRDWGRGFTHANGRQDDADRGAHIGLEGMHERVTLLGGRCAVRSRPGRGTTIDVSVPLPELTGASS